MFMHCTSLTFLHLQCIHTPPLALHSHLHLQFTHTPALAMHSHTCTTLALHSHTCICNALTHMHCTSLTHLHLQCPHTLALALLLYTIHLHLTTHSTDNETKTILYGFSHGLWYDIKTTSLPKKIQTPSNA